MAVRCLRDQFVIADNAIALKRLEHKLNKTPLPTSCCGAGSIQLRFNPLSPLGPPNPKRAWQCSTDSPPLHRIEINQKSNSRENLSPNLTGRSKLLGELNLPGWRWWRIDLWMTCTRRHVRSAKIWSWTSSWFLFWFLSLLLATPYFAYKNRTGKTLWKTPLPSFLFDLHYMISKFSPFQPDTPFSCWHHSMESSHRCWCPSHPLPNFWINRSVSKISMNHK